MHHTVSGDLDGARETSPELRSVEYWRRLVAARLDLAIAALTDPDEPPRHALPPSACLPAQLSRLVRLPACDLLAEAGTLEQLRDVLSELDSYRDTLRATASPDPVEHPDTLSAQTT